MGRCATVTQSSNAELSDLGACFESANRSASRGELLPFKPDGTAENLAQLKTASALSGCFVVWYKANYSVQVGSRYPAISRIGFKADPAWHAA